MNNSSQHSDLSRAIATTFDTTLHNSDAVRWNDLCVASPITSNPDFGIVVRGEINKVGEKGFDVSLRQNFNEETWGKGNEIFGAFAPLEAGYEPLMSTIDKMQDFLRQSFREPAEPLHTESTFAVLSQDIMQPLLDALMADDFALAAELTPAKYRLCGYQEITEPYEHTSYGHGWAGQFETTLIAPGRYPVFVEDYNYVENESMYSNNLKDFRGLFIYMAGQCVADSAERSKDHYPFPNTVFISPYAHATAHSILEGTSDIKLLPPYEAKAVDFEYDGEMHRTYKIVDNSLPERMRQSPITLRNKSAYIRNTQGLSEGARKLFDRFVRDYRSGVGSSSSFGVQIPLHFLVKDNFYTPETLQELLDKNKVQRKPGEVEAFELTAKERLQLFHSYQIGNSSGSLRWDEEYKRTVMESKKKPPLSSQIEKASARSAQNPNGQDRSGTRQEPAR